MTKGRFGWFHCPSFLIAFEPSLECFEQKLKSQFTHSMEEINNLPEMFKEQRHAHEKILKQEGILGNSLEKMQIAIDDFLINGMYSAYSLLLLLNRFEFYYLHCENYEKYIRQMFEENILEEAFQEEERIKKDVVFFESNLPDEVNVGVFLVDMRDFKTTTITEMNKKLELIRNLSKDKFKAVLDSNIDKQGDIMKKLEEDPTTIEDYIDTLIYVSGEFF